MLERPSRACSIGEFLLQTGKDFAVRVWVVDLMSRTLFRVRRDGAESKESAKACVPLCAHQYPRMRLWLLVGHTYYENAPQRRASLVSLVASMSSATRKLTPACRP